MKSTFGGTRIAGISVNWEPRHVDVEGADHRKVQSENGEFKMQGGLMFGAWVDLLREIGKPLIELLDRDLGFGRRFSRRSMGGISHFIFEISEGFFDATSSGQTTGHTLGQAMRNSPKTAQPCTLTCSQKKQRKAALTMVMALRLNFISCRKYCRT